MKLTWIFVLATLARTARAEDRPSAADVAGDPRPGDESGRVDREPGEPTGRAVARGVLAVPRTIFSIAMAPIRGGVWVVDRYQLPARYRRLLRFTEGPWALAPAIRFDSDYGFVAGAGLRGPIGAADLRLFAGYGGRYRSTLAGSLRVPIVPDRLALEVDAAHQRRPNDRFFGIGNAMLEAPPAMPVDALADDGAVDTRYSRRRARASLAADVRIASALHARVTGAVADVELGPARTSDLSIEQVFAMDSLVGFPGYRTGYAELDLRWDSRRPGSRDQPRELISRGSLLSAYAGRQVIEDGASFWRYGIDAQQFLHLADGPRSLSLRLHGEGVTAERGEIPFTELPSLGGGNYLRGFQIERFRDRVAAVGTVEYQWDVARMLYASVFVDAGRVFESVDDIGLGDLRYSAGIAFEAHTSDALVGRVSIASSLGEERGVFVNLYLSPVFEVTPRAVRR